MTVKNADTLEALWQTLSDQREREDFARRLRIQAEEKIIAALDSSEEAFEGSGSRTTTLPSGRKITVKRGLTYGADIGGVIDVMANLRASRVAGQELSTPVKTKSQITLDEKGYEWYRDNDKEVFDELSRFVYVKPKKTAVTITEAKKEPLA